MTRPRAIPYRLLEVHAAPARRERATVQPSARLAFAQMLKRQRQLAPPAAPEVRIEDGAAGDSPDEAGELEEESAPQSQDAPAYAATRKTALDWGDSLKPDAATLDALLAGAPAAIGGAGGEALGLAEWVSARVARFCNERAVDDGEGWNVRIELRSDVLRDTTLELGLSVHWLQLRFLTADPQSRRQIIQHEDALREALDTKLHRRRDISIELV